MNKIFQQVRIIALAVVFSFGLSYVYAWTTPTATPPGGNVSAPINTGDNTQYKAGNLVLNDSALPFVNGLIVRYGNVGIGTTAPTQKLSVAGTIESTSGGIKFPDGSVQMAAGIGFGQTWQDVTTSRASGVTYTNDTGKPIMIALTHVQSLAFYAGGVLVGNDQGASNNTTSLATFIVPAGTTYSLTAPQISRWTELR